MMLDESVTSLCLPFLPPVLAYIDLVTRKQTHRKKSEMDKRDDFHPEAAKG